MERILKHPQKSKLPFYHAEVSDSEQCLEAMQAM